MENAQYGYVMVLAPACTEPHEVPAFSPMAGDAEGLGPCLPLFFMPFEAGDWPYQYEASRVGFSQLHGRNMKLQSTGIALFSSRVSEAGPPLRSTFWFHIMCRVPTFPSQKTQ